MKPLVESQGKAQVKRLQSVLLDTAAEHSPHLRGPDYRRLQQRAEQQRGAVEGHRPEAARAVLSAVSPA